MESDDCRIALRKCRLADACVNDDNCIVTAAVPPYELQATPADAQSRGIRREFEVKWNTAKPAVLAAATQFAHVRPTRVKGDSDPPSC